MIPRASIPFRAYVVAFVLSAPFWLGVVVAARRFA